MNTFSTYRPDIDGLRAIAVLSVIAFHFAPGLVPGGYLGVDIFFVLSGFLITRIVDGETLAGHFTLRGFYERRIRRIVPALLVMLGCSSIAACVILLPDDLVRFGKALAATLVFIPNAFAWLDTNYFSPDAGQQPLLHTWSLGVEEQFYVFFPLMLVLLRRHSPRLTLPVVIGITCASFALQVSLFIFTSGAFAFFMLPARAWELGAGAIVALASFDNESEGPTFRVRAFVGVLGFALVTWTLFLSRDHLAPLSRSAFAVVGTALLVGVGHRRANFLSRVLGAAPLVWTGLISYSLYLWHWPVIVFSKYYLVRELRPQEVAAAAIFILSVAAISWWFVERPFRRREFPVRRLYLGAAIGSSALAASALVFVLFSGLPARLSPDARLMSEPIGKYFQCARRDVDFFGDAQRFGSTQLCALTPPARNPAGAQLALLGNSHARMYAPVWSEILASRSESGVLVSMTGCLPTIAVNYTIGCLHEARISLGILNELPQIRTVVLAMTWLRDDDLLVDASGHPMTDHEDVALIAALDDLILRLRDRGRRVVLIGPIAVPGWNLASEVSRDLAFGWPVKRPLELPRAEFSRQFAAILKHFSGRQDVIFVRPDLIQCNANSCPYVMDGRPLFADNSHLAATAIGRFRGIFAAALE